jgi:cellulose synthase operon protein C
VTPLTLHRIPLLRLACLAAALTGALLAVGCSGNSAPEFITAGKSALARKEPRAAAIQFKNALQKEPQSGEARYLLGKALLDSGDPNAAVLELGKALDLKHSDTLVVPLLARALLISGQSKKLTDLYGSVELADPAATADLKATLAGAWAALGNRDKTEQAVDAALRAVPEHSAARVLQARLVAGRKNYDEALLMVDKVLQRDPDRADGWHLKGELLWFAKNDDAGAEAAFRKALAADPRHVATHSSLIDMRLRRQDVPGMKTQVEALKAVLPRHPQTRFVEAQLAFLEQDYKKAREMTQQLMRAAPEHAGVQQLAGAIEFLNGSLLLAENYLIKAVQLDPSLVVARRMLGQTYLRLGQPQKALAALQPLLEGDTADAGATAVAAEAFLQSSDTKRAAELFTQAARLNPKDPRIRTALALSRMTQGQAAAAFTELDAVAQQDESSYADMAIISVRLNRGEFDAALKAVDALTKKQPENALSHTLRGRIHVARKDAAAARTSFDKALAIDPRYFTAITGLALLDLTENQPAAAKKHFEDLLQAEPRNHLAMMALADLRQRAGDPRESVVQLLSQAVKTAPNEAEPRLQLVAAHLRNKDHKNALVAAQDALAAMPNNLDVLESLARAQLDSGDFQQAVSSFRSLAGANPQSARPYLGLADTYTAMRDKAAAENSLKKALQLQPNLVSAQRGLIDMALANNRPRDALEVARSMQKQRPEDEGGYLLEGEVQMRLKNRDAAITALRNGLQRTQSGVLAGRLHGALLSADRRAEADRLGSGWEKEHPDDLAFASHLADVAIARGAHAEAEVRLRKLLASQPDNALALNNMAWLTVKLGKPGAVEFAERANQLMPNQAVVMDTLAQALAANNQAAKALVLQKSVVERAPDNLALRLNLAKIALQAGDKTLARSELEKLVRQGARFANQNEVAELLKTL